MEINEETFTKSIIDLAQEREKDVSNIRVFITGSIEEIDEIEGSYKIRVILTEDGDYPINSTNEIYMIDLSDLVPDKRFIVKGDRVGVIGENQDNGIDNVTASLFANYTLKKFYSKVK